MKMLVSSSGSNNTDTDICVQISDWQNWVVMIECVLGKKMYDKKQIKIYLSRDCIAVVNIDLFR